MHDNGALRASKIIVKLCAGAQKAGRDSVLGWIKIHSYINAIDDGDVQD